MAITKLSHVKERKSGNPNAGLYNCIDYILNPDKTEERYIGGNAGSTTQEVYNRMMATKQNFANWMADNVITSLLVSHQAKRMLSPASILLRIFVKNISPENMNTFFSVHTDHAHMRAHIVFNSVSLVDGVKVSLFRWTVEE